MKRRKSEMFEIINLLFLLNLLLLHQNVHGRCVNTDGENSKYACSLRTFLEVEDTSTTSNSEKNDDNNINRVRRKASDRSISDLRKTLNDERIREKLLAANSTPKFVLNDSFPSSQHLPEDRLYAGVFTRKQDDNSTRNSDKIRMVHKQQHNTQVDYPAVSETDCNFEEDCLWTWRKDIANGFFITSAKNYNNGETGPTKDANGRDGGSFLLLRAPHMQTEFHVVSPLFTPTKMSCRLQVWIYQEYMEKSVIRVVIDKVTNHASSMNNHTQWVLDKISGNNEKKWTRYVPSIGKISENFTIILEVVPAKNHSSNATLAFDNLALANCYPRNDDTCTAPLKFQCKSNNFCINNTRVCDITPDCKEGEDEKQNCDQMPYGARCSFEEDMCGWYNDKKALEWIRHNGTTPTNFTGPSNDHTYMNSSGKYLFVNMLKDNTFASIARLKSIIFNPPPTVHGNISSKFYNSCVIRFYLHQTGKHKSGILLQVTELRPNYNQSRDISWSYHDHGDRWVRQVFILPNITSRYYLSFDAKRGLRYISDIAIDDVSLSPECFGLNIPSEELRGYNYWDPMRSHMLGREPHKDFVNKTHYEISTCGAIGRFGPTPSDCTRAYNRTEVKVTVLHDPGLSGMQKWIVPADGYYSLIAFGASGGKGSGATGSSRGAMVRTVVQLKRGQELIFLVGQQGSDACIKTLHHQENSSCWTDSHDIPKGIRGVLNMDINDGGGGGGGATYIFMRNRSRQAMPLAIAAGGGGLGLGRFIDTGHQHGQAINTSKTPVPGKMYGKKSSGAGGGWQPHVGMLEAAYVQIMGKSLLEGALGGKACYNSTDYRGDGGFGGGGGGCRYGGGGGGYAGGDASSGNTTNGGGGYSFLDPSRSIPYLLDVNSGYNVGPGYVMIMPAISGCDCDYRCVSLDVKRSQVACICPYGWKLDSDGKICIQVPGYSDATTYPAWFVLGLIITVICLLVAFGIFCFTLYNRYQMRASGLFRKKMLSRVDLQLDRLRGNSGSMVTEYNPNYEFLGTSYSQQDLKCIPREQLSICESSKSIGQGAFGEVYKGYYKKSIFDAHGVPVAVKTLPKYSTRQSELDFVVEALIMSRFDHPNVVHFIGVCFDKHPRFIILELLDGGDVKKFLRDFRPRQNRPSLITMKDLINIAIDIAKGCKYLEGLRFVHRDIAARNCLLTTRGPGRVAKIADFGMSKDIYRSDYYKKGGKAMLAVKWMPPEAFIDGLFSCKTDIWSFGVLIWEIMSMGYMPYTGLTNHQVMKFVEGGGRLAPPANCPGPVYALMKQCWHLEPEERIDFACILERLGYCLQDPEVLGTSLPIFYRPLSDEENATILKSMNAGDSLEEQPLSSDYLIPNISGLESIGTSSIERLIPDSSDSNETSFIMPNSRSTQPLLTDDQNKDEISDLGNDNYKTTPKDAVVSLSNNVTETSNDVKQEEATVVLKNGISLDAAALIKQSRGYANIKMANSITGNGIVANGPNLNAHVNIDKSKSPISVTKNGKNLTSM